VKTTLRSLPLARWTQDTGSNRAAEFLREGRAHELGGCMAEALQCYSAAVEAAERSSERAIAAESLRRSAVVHHRRSQPMLARQLCERSHRIALALGDPVLAAEALNALAGFDLESGSMSSAREKFHEALELGGSSAHLRGKAEQNLGILANVRGDPDEALAHYRESLLSFESIGDDRGCAIAYHNLGIVSVDCERWEDADRYFRLCLGIARALGDIHLEGLGLLNQAEVHLARRDYEGARHNVESALGIFDQLGSVMDKADAYRVIGRIYRETGRNPLAESRLRNAMELAVSTGAILTEAEVARELGLLYQSMDRFQEALAYLNIARTLFGRLDAKRDLADVSSLINELEKSLA
jgi:tetratricopeptide (TPR) repeat protein